ncbi:MULTISPECIES: peptide chain release factor N(5)-glutamine methyltransferase [unclassified Mucilaginibacter]|uniref:peptide chain release factor N(5)-glutamine methyltransferase n=1 Tax=unclassified Mucilaginibacter TaxID=2617802 RepID=UPI0009597285|nr:MULTISPECIES: peptide chain release factor N(5)-glutamine methyltransferase [unclassified Mucilaginibacter]HEK21878.1 peptide chain release factor N(5)-glutamine methyltransferase [Bacteroidota bacterium]OJW18468.1 MAG: protein-(glutamine-N5) methyltransferase, release factor-specific [Mucilaginibacter sp. 44-25]PLW89904.1 MAG: peptide chain release factor N(5)-glutamine methyltransferase [Mucilaginibacter sp.]PMP65608.1 MAG: peptide chain release factor N(5)-glutamine methyltransferase [Muc
MKTIKDVLLSFKNNLQNLYSYNEALAIAMLVLEDLTGMQRSRLKAFEQDELSGEILEKIYPILEELKTGKPVQYILGTAEFYGLTFLVNPATLIPRPETEELVEWILASKKSKVQETISVLDIGTGTGCIAVSLKKHLNNAWLSAIDISEQALNTARKNANLNQVDVSFIQGDILNIKQDHELSGNQFDVIVSNPPYVTGTDKVLMHSNVLNFEPHAALFVTDDEPLLFYKAIVRFALNSLKIGGELYFEINEAFGKEMVDLLTNNYFKDIELKKDLTGRDRMIKAVKF